MTNGHLANVIRSMEGAFDIPEFRGEASIAQPKLHVAPTVFRTSLNQLTALIKDNPNSPELRFAAAIASRHLGNQGAYHDYIDEALQLNPSHTESLIAKREGDDYLDPFCYLSIDHLLQSMTNIRPSASTFLNSNSARMDSIRVGLRVKPICVLKYPLSKFRQPPSDSMDVGLTLETCAVLPGSPGIPEDFSWPVGDHARFNELVQPFVDVMAGKRHFSTILAVCPLLADDPNDPFFKTIYINPFPVAMPFSPPDYQPFRGRYEGYRLCSPPYLTWIAVMDNDCNPLLLQQVDLNPISHHLKSTYDILRVLPEQPITMQDWQSAASTHDRCFSYHITGNSGRSYFVPKYRTGNERINVIFDLEVRNGSPRAKRGHKQEATSELSYDIFVSHSHDDKSLSEALSIWISSIWPQLHLFKTSRDQSELDQLVPGYYFLCIQRSKCVLFICSTRSSRSTYPILEFGQSAQLGIPIIAYCHRKGDLVWLQDHELWSEVCSAVCFEDQGLEQSLIEAIASALHLQVPRSWEPGRLRHLISNANSDPGVVSTFVPADGGVLIPDPEKLARGIALSREEALAWLNIVEKHVSNRARMEGVSLDRLPTEEDPQRRLIYAMLTADDTSYARLLRPFASLLNGDFCEKVMSSLQVALDQDDELAPKYKRLLDAAQALLNE